MLKVRLGAEMPWTHWKGWEVVTLISFQPTTGALVREALAIQV